MNPVSFGIVSYADAMALLTKQFGVEETLLWAVTLREGYSRSPRL